MMPRHVALGVALTCGAIAVARLPPPPDPPETRFAAPRIERPAPRRVARLRVELRNARHQLVDAERRDRALRPLGAVARPGRPPAFHTEVPMPADARRAIADRLGAVWRRIGTPSPEIGVAVVLVEYGRRTQILPPATDGHTCVVELPFAWNQRWILRSSDTRRSDELDLWLTQGIGPCGFYATFGRPGPLVEQWLLERSFDLAWENWTTPIFREPDEPAQLGRLVARLTRWGGDARYARSLDALACQAGHLDRCRTVLFRPDTISPEARRLHAVPGVVTQSWGWSARFPHSHRFLADLVRETGRDRFAAFWRSPQPVDRAFDDAMGMSIEQWTARWQRARMGGMSIGAGVRWSSALLGMLVAGICVAAVAALSRRRQVA